MKHIGTCHVGDSPDSTFSHSVLMVCANSRERERLFKAAAMIFEGVGTEHAIVGMVALDRDTD
mgnify:CR=1 FL=1